MLGIPRPPRARWPCAAGGIVHGTRPGLFLRRAESLSRVLGHLSIECEWKVAAIHAPHKTSHTVRTLNRTKRQAKMETCYSDNALMLKRVW